MVRKNTFSFSKGSKGNEVVGKVYVKQDLFTLEKKTKKDRVWSQTILQPKSKFQYENSCGNLRMSTFHQTQNRHFKHQT